MTNYTNEPVLIDRMLFERPLPERRNYTNEPVSICRMIMSYPEDMDSSLEVANYLLGTNQDFNITLHNHLCHKGAVLMIVQGNIRRL
jgi:hypothetical protein